MPRGKVWCFIGDGETDEPETLGAISLAGRSGLGNLIWVVNCNLQRLDGPVRGNSKIIQELEGVFRGAGWNVIKVVWGSKWDELLARDVDGALLNKMNTTSTANSSATPSRMAPTSANTSSDPTLGCGSWSNTSPMMNLQLLPRGGHDYLKLFAAYKAAVEETDRPTVILAKTIKGWTLGQGFEARNATHQLKKMTKEQMLEMRERLHLEDEIPEARSMAVSRRITSRRPIPNELQYLVQRRRELGGALPSDRQDTSPPSPCRSKHRSMISTRGPAGARFDDDGLHRPAPIDSCAIRSSVLASCRSSRRGSHLRNGLDVSRVRDLCPVRASSTNPSTTNCSLSYSEDTDGQILEEGITEAGSMSSFIAAGTSYANYGVPMVPFFTFYSMFGFQRVGDLIWSAADSRTRGFLMGATAGRTT